jgi:hypothetical protein
MIEGVRWPPLAIEGVAIETPGHRKGGLGTPPSIQSDEN